MALAYEGLIPAPSHNHCNGICEGCRLYPKCPEEMVCNQGNCIHSIFDLSFDYPDWRCDKENELPDNVAFVFAEDADGEDIQTCPYFEKINDEDCEEKE